MCFILESDSVFVLWILPGGQKTGHVGCADCDLFGDTGSTGICIVSSSADWGVRNLECSSIGWILGRYCRMDLIIRNYSKDEYIMEMRVNKWRKK